MKVFNRNTKVIETKRLQLAAIVGLEPIRQFLAGGSLCVGLPYHRLHTCAVDRVEVPQCVVDVLCALLQVFGLQFGAIEAIGCKKQDFLTPESKLPTCG